MKSMIVLLTAAALSGTMAAPASAAERNRQRPPVLVSPDLSASWVVQLDRKTGRKVMRKARRDDGLGNPAAVQVQPARRTRPAGTGIFSLFQVEVGPGDEPQPRRRKARRPLDTVSVMPQETQTAGLFAPLGTAIETDDLARFDRLVTASALMGTYFGILETAGRWLEAKGVAYDQGRAYLTQLFAGLAHAMQTSEAGSFEELRHEFSTRGGLNEQVFRVFVAHGGKAALEDGLDAVLARAMRG